MESAAPLVVLIAVALVLARASLTKATVFEYERGLRYTNGKFRGELSPGSHWIYRRNTFVRKVDVRPRVVSVPGQEVLSADGVSLKVSLAATYEVADPSVAINTVESYEQAVYTTLQLSVREIIGAAKIDDLLDRRDEFSSRLMELSVEPVSTFGVKLIACSIKDIMFPGPLKKMFAQVVQAQKEGQASLERARGESAALRNLANAARLIEEKPSLMQLRLLQEVGGQTGNTIVLGFPQAATPLPVRDASTEKSPHEINPSTEGSWEEPE
jgi:regulator of protease activity HflC (stomatin/prohibitin superfamily)